MESIPDLFRIPAVVFGIGLVIFVHELGHFIAARLCGGSGRDLQPGIRAQAVGLEPQGDQLPTLGLSPWRLRALGG